MGHLFVAQGDLTKLACDAVLIPCDSGLNVNPVWESLLPPNLPPGGGSWWRLPGVADQHGVVTLPNDCRRRIRAAVLIDGRSEPSDVVHRLWRALNAVTEGLSRADGRALPLIGIPLVGTGDGGLRGRRGEVIDEILEHHRRSPIAADLALILWYRRDFAAAQERRDNADWPDLSTIMLERADRLGTLAATGQLSLFLGSGVSLPAGLPDWWNLLKILATAAGTVVPQTPSPYEAASPIVQELGDRYHDEIRTLLDVSRYAVGHALLASLRIKQMVTTNFDPCMELALDAVLHGQFRVLARQLTEGRMPWVLKLHGDIKEPESIVLTVEDKKSHETEGSALRGVVQSLMLTSHLLFVGFSLTDESFLDLAEAVTSVRSKAHTRASVGAGTAVALTPSVIKGAGFRDLDIFAMVDDDDATLEASRLLEIFLDRLCWSAASASDLAAEYLLDDDYESALSPADKKLREMLKTLENASSDVKSCAGWKRVEQALKDLGSKKA